MHTNKNAYLQLYINLTNLSDVEGDVERIEDVVDGRGRDHEAGIDCAANNPTKRIPDNGVNRIFI